MEASIAQSVNSTSQSSDREDAVLYRKITWRLMPLLVLGYIISYVDRTNVAYGQLQMKDALLFGDMVFGLGATALFVGYAAFQIPSNLLLARVGIRVTLLCIMVLWGVASAATMLVTTPTQFYVVRFLVGTFEAGFGPGVLYYLSLWFPPQRRARANGMLFVGLGIAPLVAGPLAGAVMTWLHGVGDLDGWQWLFLLEGLPAVLVGVVAWFWLDDSPEDAKWLTARDRQRVRENLASATPRQATGVSWTHAIRNRYVWGIAPVSFLLALSHIGLSFWQPTLFKGFGLSLLEVGMAAVPPALAGIVASLWFGGRSDRRRERRLHFTVAALTAATGLILTTSLPSHFFTAIVGLSITSAGLSAAVTVLWACPSEVVPKALLPVGIAVIGTATALSGVVAPPFIAMLLAATGGFAASLNLLAAGLVLAALQMNAVLISYGRSNVQAQAS